MSRKDMESICWILLFIIVLVIIFTLEQYSEIQVLICNSKI